MSNFSFALFTDKNFVDCTLFQYGWEKCDPHHSFGPAARNHYLFHYIISGKGLLISTDSSKKDTEYHLHAGQGFLISPGQTNTYIADSLDPWEYEMIYIAGHTTESSFHLIGHLYLALDALIKSSNRRMTAVGGQLKDFYAREAVSFVEHNYQNDITVEDIAAFCNLNRSYFGKIFKDVLSVTPQEFLIRFRMAKACEYMETTNLPIGEISARVGYPSQLHFSRAFKKTYGQSPREWRLANQHK